MRAVAEVRLLAPIPRPRSVRDGRCFLQHLRNCYRALGRDTRLHPVWSPAPGSAMFDVELEVAAGVGRPGRNLDPDTAEDHVVGDTVFNDWTARDHQLRDLAQGSGLGKSKDGASTLFPALVAVDELVAYRRDGRLALELSATVNEAEITRGAPDRDWTFGESPSLTTPAERQTGAPAAPHSRPGPQRRRRTSWS